MSKKVVTFLVVLFAIAAIGILVAKRGSAPVATSTTTEVASTAADSAPAKTEETKAEDKPAAEADKPKEESAAAPADKESSLLGDGTDADKLPKVAETPEAEKKPQPLQADMNGNISTPEPKVSVSPTPDEEKKAQPIVKDTTGSLLAPSASLDIDMDNALAERAMGDPDAPVVMIEYASMTCPHCARFHNEILPKIKPTLIDTGKLRLIFRDYPLDTHALRAAMMARCTDRSRYFNLVEVIFKNQDRWVKSNDPLAGLKQLGALAGMDSSFIEACIKDSQLEQALLAGMQDAQRKYKIKATPTFIFNNDAEELSGDQMPEDFERIVDKLTKKGRQ